MMRIWSTWMACCSPARGEGWDGVGWHTCEEQMMETAAGEPLPRRTTPQECNRHIQLERNYRPLPCPAVAVHQEGIREGKEDPGTKRLLISLPRFLQA